jgi:hypothetical protein
LRVDESAAVPMTVALEARDLSKHYLMGESSYARSMAF